MPVRRIAIRPALIVSTVYQSKIRRTVAASLSSISKNDGSSVVTEYAYAHSDRLYAGATSTFEMYMDDPGGSRRTRTHKL